MTLQENKELEFMISRVLSSARIRIKREEIAPIVNDLCHYAQVVFERIGEFDTHVLIGGENVKIEDIKILKEFQHLITPRTIKFVPNDYFSKDVKSPVKPLADKLISGEESLNHYINCMMRFRTFFRNTINENVISLDSIKTNIALRDKEDCYPQQVHGQYMCIDRDEAFYPIYIKSNIYLELYQHSKFNVPVQDVKMKFLRRWIVE